MERDVCFVDQNFINASPLTRENILAYFAISKFYDRTCNNEILKMQSQFAGIDLSSHLASMVGIFYSLEYSDEENTLFVIKKGHNNGNEISTLEMYYVIHGYIYLAPTNASLHNSKIIEIFWHLNQFIDEFVEHRQFDPFTGFYFSKSEVENGKASGESTKFLCDVFDDYKKIVN